MLPFGGQGSNQAIEDGAALGYLLQNVSDAATTAERLKMFEKVRKDRASRVQILSSVRVGKEIEVEEKLWRHAGDMTSGTFHDPFLTLASFPFLEIECNSVC